MSAAAIDAQRALPLNAGRVPRAVGASGAHADCCPRVSARAKRARGARARGQHVPEDAIEMLSARTPVSLSL